MDHYKARANNKRVYLSVANNIARQWSAAQSKHHLSFNEHHPIGQWWANFFRSGPKKKKKEKNFGRP